LVDDAGGPIFQWMNGYWDQVKYFFSFFIKKLLKLKDLRRMDVYPELLFRWVLPALGNVVLMVKLASIPDFLIIMIG
jgi:hypothetical protein